MEKLDLPYFRAENSSALLGTWFLPVGGERREGQWQWGARVLWFHSDVEHHPQKNGVPGPCLLPRQGKTDEKQ